MNPHPHHDHAAEQQVLGAALVDPRATAEMIEGCPPGNFHTPAHETIATRIEKLAREGHPVTAVSIAHALTESGELARVGGAGYLHTLTSLACTWVSVGYFAAILREATTRRALHVAGTRIVQMSENATTKAGEAVEAALGEVRAVRERELMAEDLPITTLHELLAQTTAEPNWLIPGLLEYGDRMLLTAGEGHGKSMLARQIAMCTAIGLHPFDFTRVEPATVLVIDCENSRAMTVRRYRPLVELAAREGRPLVETRFFIEVRPQGLDLTSARDRAWLMKRVETIRPGLLVIGPLYRLHHHDPNSEENARSVSVVLDEARHVSGCAVLTEAHAPHSYNGQLRSMRPAGSSLWMRWPELGYGMRFADPADPDAARTRSMTFTPWRGSRDERSWPERIRAGGPGRWPWVVDADGTVVSIDGRRGA